MNKPENLIFEIGEQRYRRDIDGLRAVAVLSVILFHGGFRTFSGGFVGVDVFFVISGFLITGIVLRDLQCGEFSLINFYERRIRRIFPALFAMLAASTVAAFVLLLPADFKSFGISSIGVVFSASNFIFMRRDGYFQQQSDLQPLLHTWSLAVEEQFYLVFPAVLCVIFRLRPKGVPLFVLVVLGTSFVACVGMTLKWPTQAFYLAPTRAWELMLGAALALGLVRRIESIAAREVLSTLGLLAIIWAVVLFDANTRFPGYAAMLPCLGAATLIHTAPGTRIGSWLSNKWLVGVGLISYSLYLWHWPILVFAKYYFVREMMLLETTIALLTALIVATLSWRFVEKPFRNRSTFSRRKVFQLAAGISGAFLVFSGVIVAFQGIPQRMGRGVTRLADAATDMTPYRNVCLFRPGRDTAAISACRIGAASPHPSILLWGDSHADAISPAIDLVTKRSRMAVINATHVSCPPILDVEVVENSQSRECRSWNDGVRRLLLADAGIKVVILSARWAGYAHGVGYGLDANKRVKLVGDTPDPLYDGLESTLRLLKGRRVLLILSTPEIKYDVPSSLAKLAQTRVAAELRPTASEHEARQRIVRGDFLRLGKKYGSDIIDPARFLCKDHCEVQAHGHPYYSDNNHLSRRGALSLAPQFQGKLR